MRGRRLSCATYSLRIDDAQSSRVGAVDDNVSASSVEDFLSRAVVAGEIPQMVIILGQDPHVAFAQLLAESPVDFAEESRAQRGVDLHEDDARLLVLWMPNGHARFCTRGETYAKRLQG